MQSMIDQLQGKVKSYKKQIEEAKENATLNLAHEALEAHEALIEGSNRPTSVKTGSGLFETGHTNETVVVDRGIDSYISGRGIAQKQGYNVENCQFSPDCPRRGQWENPK